MSYTRNNGRPEDADAMFADPFPPGEPQTPTPSPARRAANPSRGEQAVGTTRPASAGHPTAPFMDPDPDSDQPGADGPRRPSTAPGDASRPSRQGRVADFSLAYREKLAAMDPEERAAVISQKNAKAAATRKRNQSIVERAEIMMNCALKGKAADKVRELYPDLGNDVYFMDAALAGLLAKLPKGDVGAWGLVLRLFGEDKLRITGPDDNRDDKLVVTFLGRRKDRKTVIDVTPDATTSDDREEP